MPPSDVIAAIDQGTTGTRCLLFDHRATVIGSAYETHQQYYPSPGWVEHDPNELFERTIDTVRNALEDANLNAQELTCIGLTNQRETTVLWEGATGEPVANAIVWQDRRTADRIDTLEEEGYTELIRSRTGLEPDAYFSATKLEWLLDHAGENLRDRAEALQFGTIDSWLLDRLTGNHVTDVTNASRTMLFDIGAERWDDELLEVFDIPRSILPEVRPSVPGDPLGQTDPDGPLGAAIPVTGVLGDQQAALFGQTCFDRGEAKNTYGTGAFYLVNTGEEPVTSDQGLVTTIAYGRAGERTRYALEGSIFSTGATIEWLNDVGLIEDLDELEALASSVESHPAVYLVPAFTGLGAPHWDPRARGTLIGMTRDTSRADIAYAALASIGFQTRDVAEAIASDLGTEPSKLRIDGGAVTNDQLCQLQADILGLPILRAAQEETTALGAAFAAGLSAGVWESTDALKERWRSDARFTPTQDRSTIERSYARWLEAIERAADWAEEAPAGP